MASKLLVVGRSNNNSTGEEHPEVEQVGAVIVKFYVGLFDKCTAISIGVEGA